MTTPSSRDLERLSAYLDGQLSQTDRTRLEIRIQSDPALASALEEIRQTRAFLRRTPRRRAPRNFTLTPGMAGIRPPVPRLVPVLSWASAVAMLFFIFTLAAGLVGQLSLGAAASMPPPAPNAFAAAPAATVPPASVALAPMVPGNNAAPATPAPAVAAPATTAPLPGSSNPPAADQTLQPTPTGQASLMAAEQATPPAVTQLAQPSPALKAQQNPVNLWLFIWAGLAGLLGASAILALGLNKRAFRRKNPRR